jgi:hypothetical protein
MEREADAAAAHVAGSMPAAGIRSGAVPDDLRRPVEYWAGVDLSGLVLDTTSDPRQVAGGRDTVAAFEGNTIHAGLGGPLAATAFGREVIAHELVHAAQLRMVNMAETSPRVMAPLRLSLCSSKPKNMLPLLRSGAALSASDASKILDYYEYLGESERDDVVIEFHKVGQAKTGVQRLLAAVDPDEMKKRAALISDIEERVQRLAAQAAAGMTGDQMAQVQGTKMKTEAEARALAAAQAAAKAKALPPPATVSDAEIEKEQNAETKKTSPVTATVTNAWDALAVIPGAQDKWNARATAVISKIVAACNAKAPDLGITAANIKWAPHDIAQAGANVYSFSANPVPIGMRFVETAEADPEYCVRTVVHEVVGHPQFGDRYKSYEAQIYAEAHTKEPSLGKPWDTQEETDTFAYIGTEIYAALRELPFQKPLSPADAKKGLVTAIEPEPNIDNKIGLLKSKYDPKVARGLLQGLYERFRIDPRIDPKALALFIKIAEKHFPGVLKK